jgi:hypothetical protein
MTATESWTGADGAQWPAQWTTVGTATINGNRGRLTPASGSFADANALLAGMTASADADLTIDVQPTIPDAETRAFVSTQVNGINSPFPANGYAFRLIYYANGSVNLGGFRWKNFESQGIADINKASVGFAAPVRLRIQVAAGVIKAKFWATSATEPTAWDATFTDPDPLPAGKIMLASQSPTGSRGADFDNLSDTAGAPVVDETAPVVTSFTATAGDGQNVLAWSATDNVAVTRYTVTRGGTTIYDGAGTSYIDTGLINGSAYPYTLTAYDAAGNTKTATASATPAAGAVIGGVISPTDANLVYSPYTWKVAAGVASTVSSGAYVRAYLTGSPTALTARFDMTGMTGTQRMSVYVDSRFVSDVNVAASVSIPVNPQGWPKHVVELVFHHIDGPSLWTSPLKFLGFTAEPNTVVTAPARTAPYRLLELGDSILKGYLVGGTSSTDTRVGWGYPLRSLLGTEVGIAAFSGQGWNNPGDGVPAASTTYDKVYDGVARTFTPSTEPHLVVINLGQNDNPSVTTTATAVLNGLLGATTATKIAVVQPWSSTTHRAGLEAAIAACSAPSRVTYVDTTGWLLNGDTVDGTHPQGYINLGDLSPRLARALLPLLSGSTSTPVAPKRFINRGGSLVPIG